MISSLYKRRGSGKEVAESEGHDDHEGFCPESSRYPGSEPDSCTGNRKGRQERIVPRAAIGIKSGDGGAAIGHKGQTE